MKDQIIAMVSEKTGLDAGMAEKATDAVLGFLKENPDQIGDLLQLDEGMMASLKSKLGGLFKS
jgi:hypothetical protein